MTHCQGIEERFVDVAHGRSAWTAPERAHLAECADCRAAWRLAQAATLLAADRPAPDVDAIAARVQLRLAGAAPGGAGVRPLASRRRWVRLAVPLAAAAVLALAIGLGRSQGGAAPEAAPAVIVELDDLSVSELELVADAYPAPLDVTMPVGAVGLSDLTPAEMERILMAWEG